MLPGVSACRWYRRQSEMTCEQATSRRVSAEIATRTKHSGGVDRANNDRIYKWQRLSKLAEVPTAPPMSWQRVYTLRHRPRGFSINSNPYCCFGGIVALLSFFLTYSWCSCIYRDVYQIHSSPCYRYDYHHRDHDKSRYLYNCGLQSADRFRIESICSHDDLSLITPRLFFYVYVRDVLLLLLFYGKNSTKIAFDAYHPTNSPLALVVVDVQPRTQHSFMCNIHVLQITPFSYRDYTN